MIDCHTHTKYSKHASGSVTELVESAINNGVEILTITDHAPFLIDSDNRLLEKEVNLYCEEIILAKKKYHTDIKILLGMEFDFMPNYLGYVENIIRNLDLDFSIGSIHYIETKKGRINNWDIEKLNTTEYLDKYFFNLELLIDSQLFNSIGHADSILRGGVSEEHFIGRLAPLISKIVDTEISYEINCSGRFKSMIDPQQGVFVKNGNAFPSAKIIQYLIAKGVNFTIGSDTHCPEKVGRGIKKIMGECKLLGVNSVCYYENGIKKNYKL